jgi:hypothetical protein
MIKIALDAGHGLKTAGKQTPDGIKEWSINDAVCDYIVEELADYNCEIIRTDNNEGNVDEGLTTRLNSAIKQGCKVLVSIHHNAFKGIWGTHTGVGVYIDNNPTTEDKKLAELICNKLAKYTGLRNRGVKKEAFTVINTNKITAVLCEGGFMDSSIDYKIITSEAGQRAYAKAVVESLIELYDLKKKETNEPTTDKISVTYQVYDNKSKRWLPNVVDLADYAGIFGRTIGGVYVNLSKGNITYRVHTKGGGWLPVVKNRLDYAGIKGKAIDGLMMCTDTGKTIHYAVHLKKSNKWLPYVTGCNANDANNGYAGIIGQEIDAIKIYID